MDPYKVVVSRDGIVVPGIIESESEHLQARLLSEHASQNGTLPNCPNMV